MNPHSLMQLSLQSLPQPKVAPAAEVAVYRVPGRELLGQLAPLAPRFVDVEDSVDDAAQLIDPGPSAALGLGPVLIDEFFGQAPLVIGEVARIHWPRTSVDYAIKFR